MDRDVAARAALLARVAGVPGYERVVAELGGSYAPARPLLPPADPSPALVPLAESMAVVRCPDRRKLACACEGRWGCGRDGAEKDMMACLACVRSQPVETSP